MKKTFFVIIFSFLALSLAPFSASAQSGVKPLTPLCFYLAPQGSPYVQWSTRDADGVAQCPSPQTAFQMLDHSNLLDSQVVGVCWNRESATKFTIAVSGTANTNGSFTCGFPNGDTSYVWQNFIPKASFRPAGAAPPPTTTPPTTPGTGNPGSPTPTTPTTPGTTTPGSSGDCDAGFDSVGALCIPKSPFGNNGILGSSSVSDLATRIIKILLFFAGIVAVIMIIIGGYLYMTARGNDAQATSARKTLTNSIIGLIIIVLSYVIVQTIYNFIIK